MIKMKYRSIIEFRIFVSRSWITSFKIKIELNYV